MVLARMNLGRFLLSGVAMLLVSGAVVPGSASGDVSASASWTNLGCGPNACAYVAEGSHSASAGSAPADGILEVDGTTVDRCFIGPLGGDCFTQGPGRNIQEGECSKAVAITDPVATSGAQDSDKECNTDAKSLEQTCEEPFGISHNIDCPDDLPG